MMGTRFYDTITNAIIPIPSSPIVVNVLPWQGRQVILLTYAKEDALDAQHFLDRIDYVYGRLSTPRLSKILLEEVEVILIAQDTWDSYGPSKQQRIVDHSYWSGYYPVHAFDTFAHLLDLFI